MILKQIPSGYDANFAYLIADKKTKEGAIIDPSVDISKIKEEIKGFEIKYIINTHSHMDHVAGNKELKSLTGAKIIQHELSPEDHDISIKANQEIKLGSLILKIIYTPGHSKDHICILVENKLFTGDLLFVGTIGGTGERFKGSDIKEQFESLNKLMDLPGNTEIYPGHDYGPEKTTTIKHEKETNQFLV
ncbi:MBL fold metallo-hydrolase [Candidatus Woesearchaeota archaeon]|jgi:glyoxylase-like metal-dependent hydrolase (beta-lactamase superfamily II)|nr:MBL fold metallo-hydrolase [Candidatus Woesearchaeota archaeon]MBT4835184.1 MBL fold metallo-hydrolase [Candidatus Woesearchaeota archaeon]MBT6735395.1 MBL fold metallo-hydrolase [Candidatus Woesearchaeota archaeon]MBT7169460.1 MBL fold metallo-hydrolase [Candidatus Woesearchaeota archaeon]MBT7474773.1 MBL fold metallo-hydrolase [Candidatus Woesearchaeota archaeon]